MDASNIGGSACKPLPSSRYEVRKPPRTHVPFAAALLIVALVFEAASAASAQEHTYVMTGRDSFSIGASDVRSDVVYDGTQTLTIRPHGSTTRFTAHATYERRDGNTTTDAASDFVTDVTAKGDVAASADHDPDYLTVLNQPFAAQLDRQTLDDLRHLHGTLPFDFPSPFTGLSLHGYLRPGGGGTIGSRRAAGVRFEAAGPMHGELPDRPGLTLSGTIAMRGIAFYDVESALLLALDTTVTIKGAVSNRSGKDPVTITYARAIRARTLPAPSATGTP